MGEGRNGEQYDSRLLLELAVKECRLSACGRDGVGEIAKGTSSCMESHARADVSIGSRAGSFTAFNERFAENDAD